MDNNLSNIEKLIKCMNIKKIDPKTEFWMVRTKKGFFYDEFVREKFIALGWNAITKEKILEVMNEKDEKESEKKEMEIKKYIEDKYPKTIETKQAIKNFNKCVHFFYDMKQGDIVMIPSHESKLITFAEVGKYYEKDNCTYDTEIEIINRIDSGESYGTEVCPYKKRRKIKILKEIDGKKLNVNLYKALVAYHGIDNIDKYSDFILSSIYNIYYRNSKISIVFNIEKKKEIGAIDFLKFMYNICNLFSCIDEDIKISTRMNLNSPGDLTLALQNICNSGVDLMSSPKVLLGIIIVWISVGGGKIGPIQLPNAIDLFIKYREHEIKMKNENLNKRLKEKQLEEEDIKLKEEKVKLKKLYDEINEASSNLEVNENDVQGIIDINKYRHDKDN